MDDDRKSFSEWINNDNKDNNTGCAIAFFIFGSFFIIPPIFLLITIASDSPYTSIEYLVPISVAFFLAIFTYILARNKSKE